MDDDNEFSNFMGKINRIETEHHKLPIYGRLIAISDQFLTIERKNGHLMMIRKKDVLLIEPTRNQPEAI